MDIFQGRVAYFFLCLLLEVDKDNGGTGEEAGTDHGHFRGAGHGGVGLNWEGLRLSVRMGRSNVEWDCWALMLLSVNARLQCQSVELRSIFSKAQRFGE